MAAMFWKSVPCARHQTRGPGQAVLLRYTGDREGLTGKACGEEIVIEGIAEGSISLMSPCGVSPNHAA
jgi:hypothetical protein